MFRSLHMKLVLIMLLLILSLMAVVGAFLINSVTGFYTRSFYEDMKASFEDADFVKDLRLAAAEEEASYESMLNVLEGKRGQLGIDGNNRNYYLLDGDTAAFLAGSNLPDGAPLSITANIQKALLGQEGYESDVTAVYMDVAFPISGGENQFIVYIRDNRASVQRLNSELGLIIIEALVFGLAISVLLSFLLAKTMITPIERLTEGARRVAAGDFSHRLEVSSRDEIGVLTTTFNHMARVLAQTIEEVQNERNKLDTLFLHMADGVVAFGRDGALIHSNPAAERVLGRTLKGGARYDEIFGEIAAIEAVYEVGQPGFLEVEREVDQRSLAILLAPFHGESQGGIMAVIRDITQQKRTEDLRREFVANVSHELRTPLTNIRSYTETLAENEAELPPQMRESFFGVILSETDRMTHIVQDLLTLSRFDSGQVVLEPIRFPFAALITEVYNAMRMEAQNHGHTMTMELPPDLPEVEADRGRISQVIVNIVSNAIKYTPDGGIIRLEAGREADRVWLAVSDNGIGIPEKDRSRIFERFYRVDKARSRESGGTGLGLSIAQQIMRLHGGEIVLMDRDDPGLTVRLLLPVHWEADDE